MKANKRGGGHGGGGGIKEGLAGIMLQYYIQMSSALFRFQMWSKPEASLWSKPSYYTFAYRYRYTQISFGLPEAM